MAEWYETLGGMWAAVWRLLMIDAEQLAPQSQSVLATIGETGGPEARMVILRGADRRAGSVDVHTDVTSVKIREIAHFPQASLHLWSARQRLQLRMRGKIAVLQGDQAREHWARVPDGSRSNYGVTPAPGTPIPASDAYRRAPDPEKFAVLKLVLAEMDVVHLSDDYHRRALFARADDWQGQWLAP